MMRKNYMKEGKEANMASRRQNQMEQDHSAKDQFVKSEQAKMLKYSGKRPVLREENMHFNAAMINNGAHAVDFGKQLTKGIDECFPVDGQRDE